MKKLLIYGTMLFAALSGAHASADKKPSEKTYIEVIAESLDSLDKPDAKILDDILTRHGNLWEAANSRNLFAKALFAEANKIDNINAQTAWELFTDDSIIGKKYSYSLGFGASPVWSMNQYLTPSATIPSSSGKTFIQKNQSTRTPYNFLQYQQGITGSSITLTGGSESRTITAGSEELNNPEYEISNKLGLEISTNLSADIQKANRDFERLKTLVEDCFELEEASSDDMPAKSDGKSLKKKLFGRDHWGKAFESVRQNRLDIAKIGPRTEVIEAFTRHFANYYQAKVTNRKQGSQL